MFIVVEKRHRTRFLLMQKNQADRSGNHPPGIVVDTGIVHSFEIDFFLQSHGSLIGTSELAHYNVLCDENRIMSDSHQELS